MSRFIDRSLRVLARSWQNVVKSKRSAVRKSLLVLPRNSESQGSTIETLRASAGLIEVLIAPIITPTRYSVVSDPSR